MSQIRPQGALRQRRKPYESRDYRMYVATQPCLACGRHGTQAAHISAGNYARGMKADDWYCIPLCAPQYLNPGCHFFFDAGQERFARERLGLSIDALQARAKAQWIAWEAHQ